MLKINGLRKLGMRTLRRWKKCLENVKKKRSQVGRAREASRCGQLGDGGHESMTVYVSSN